MESFGARLKREREQRNITLDDIAVSTKIGTRFLAAIEEDRFDQLPGGIFNKGFVRAYARHLGMDENQAIADFVAATEPVLPEPEPQAAPVLAALAEAVPEAQKKSRGDGGIPWGIFAIVLLILACGFAVWGFYSRDKSVSPSVVAPRPDKPDVSSLSGQKDVPRSVPKSAVPEPPSAISQSVSPEPEPGSRESATSTPAARSATDAGFFHVLIKARQDSWVAITADGKQIIQDTLAAPAEQSIAARDQIVIKTGNVGALDISFNGKKLATQGEYNQVKTLIFDPSGLRP